MLFGQEGPNVISNCKRYVCPFRNIAEPVDGSATNNSAEIQAARVAIELAVKAGSYSVHSRLVKVKIRHSNCTRLNYFFQV